MKDLISLISKLITTIGQGILVLWKVIKYLIKKFWIFLVAVISAILSIFIIKKVKNKDGEVRT